jgi:hypothetical protein
VGAAPESGADSADVIDDVRESGDFFAAVTAVREALRKGHG